MLNRELNPISSLHLFGYEKNFHNFVSLIDLNKFPKVSLFSGKKVLVNLLWLFIY